MECRENNDQNIGSDHDDHGKWLWGNSECFKKIRAETRKKEKYEEIEHKYSLKKKLLNVLLEGLKQRLKARPQKLKRYDQRPESTYCSNKIKKDCTNSWVKKSIAAKILM